MHGAISTPTTAPGPGQLQCRKPESDVDIHMII